MTVTKAKFQNIAARLAGDTFADFFTVRTFTTPGAINPITGQVTGGATEDVPAFREEYDARQIDGTVIQVGDFKLLAEVAKFTTINPQTNGVQVTVDGVQCQVIRAEKDGADAMWTLQVRQL